MVLFRDHVKPRKLQKTLPCLKRGKVEEMKSEDRLEELKVKNKSTRVDFLEGFKILNSTDSINMNLHFQCGPRRQDQENTNDNEKRTDFMPRHHKCASNDFTRRNTVVKMPRWAGTKACVLRGKVGVRPWLFHFPPGPEPGTEEQLTFPYL